MAHYISLVKKAQQSIAEKLSEGDIAIDATVGNGFDTVFLARLVGATGLVYGFDIQSRAIKNTRLKLQQCARLNRVRIIQADHASLSEHIETQHHQRIKAVMFNLGYLPGADKTFITNTDTTLTALTAALHHLDYDGIMTIIAYPGHSGGERETNAVNDWCRQLDGSSFLINSILPPAGKKKAPQLMIIKRLSIFGQ